jgi:hypothetical protein
MSNEMDETNDEKNFYHLKLTPIKINTDGTNNYSEFRQKSKFELIAADFWCHIEGPEYDPPNIPVLLQTQILQAIDDYGNPIRATIPGNEDNVAQAKIDAHSWFATDKKILAIIAKAVPHGRGHIVRDCESARDAWIALEEEFKPSNNATGIAINHKIIRNRCGVDNDPVNWRETMVELYNKL